MEIFNLNNILLGHDPNYQTFDQITQILLSSYIEVGNKKLYLCELEFYVTHDEHPDPFTHKDELQAIPCKWYFHRQNGKSFKGGTFKGLDITYKPFNINKCYAGILIRSVIDSTSLIEGPCKVVDYILSTTNKEKIIDLVGDQVCLDLFDNSPMILKYDDQLKLHTIKSPRVGLTLKKSQSDAEFAKLQLQYIMRNYRYIRTDFADKIKKYKCLICLNSGPQKLKITKSWSESFEIGKKLTFEEARKLDLDKVADICKLYGYCVNLN